MDKRALQVYSTWAKENLENQIEVSLKALGINSEDDIKDAKRVGDFTVIDGDSTSYPGDLLGKRKSIIDLVKSDGYRNVIEEFAYTWFNRLIALRFMEAHGFLSHGFRIFPTKDGGIEPEIVKNVNLVGGELGLDMSLCQEYKQQGKIEELYRHILTRQCNALASQLPMLFSLDFGYLDLLLPQNLLKGETVVTRLTDIPEEAFLEDVEIIGWMYQFYISSKKDAVYASKKTITKDTLPAVTQLFTPDWIVRYMAQNSVGRLWLESYPDSPLRSEMKYYVDDAEQTPEVQAKLEEIRYKNVNPENIRIIEPCCGSGHILVYVFDLLFKMYDERGYQKRDIPTLILKNNLVGLDVDKRAAQLASFSLIMKARSVNNRFFSDEYFVKPQVYELKDSKYLEQIGYRKHIKDLGLLTPEETKLIDYIVDTFKEGKTLGSLLKVKPIDYDALNAVLDKIDKQGVLTTFNTEFMDKGLKRLRELSIRARLLSSKYDVMITNPPYRPISSMEPAVREYAAHYYPDSKADMYAMFMETGFVNTSGFIAMINMQSWMFLSTYEKLRTSLLLKKTIVLIAHLGAHAFDEIGGEVVQTAAFIIRNNVHYDGCVGKYFKLSSYESEDKKKEAFLKKLHLYIVAQARFEKLPFQMMIYWINEESVEAFSNERLGDVVDIKQGVATSDNNRFLRYWHEVDIAKIGFGLDGNVARTSNYKWFPYNKGGTPIRWYGNFDYIINYYHDGEELKAFHAIINRNHPGGRLKNPEYYFREGFTWSTLSNTFAVRYCKQGMIFDTKGSMGFCRDDHLQYYMGVLNSVVGRYWMTMIAPTLDFNPIALRQVPIIIDTLQEPDIEKKVIRCIEYSKFDWDSYEVSWDFVRHPLIKSKISSVEETRIYGAPGSGFEPGNEIQAGTIEKAFTAWSTECEDRFKKLKANEEELNRIFIDIYGLQDELTPEVEDKDVTVRLADKERDIRSLISYLVGIVMGRYSLDVDGLAYAGGKWDSSKYVTYQPDDDGIVPIYTSIGMEDGLTTKIIQLIKKIYGEETYRANIDFIAEVLRKKSNESSEETLNRYLNEGFYPDHLKIYQKRPIYWMFSSGKNSGFKSLIYMHRYNEDTLARINGKYFLPESTRKKNELDELNAKIGSAEGRERIRLEKERQKLAAAYNEAVEYGQVLDHMANKYIAIDLDDGVKENYAKFQNVEFVTDNGTKVKKDLLVALK